MKEYTHLSFEERAKIAELKKNNMSDSGIAKILGRDRTTIYREIKRNSTPPGDREYDTAQKRAMGSSIKGSILDKD